MSIEIGKFVPGYIENNKALSIAYHRGPLMDDLLEYKICLMYTGKVSLYFCTDFTPFNGSPYVNYLSVSTT